MFVILSQLPKLTFVNLSCNPLEPLFDEERIGAIAHNYGLPKLKNIVLNNTKIPFAVVFKLLDAFPQ